MFEQYTNFDRYKRKNEDTMENCVIEFERFNHKARKFKMELLQSVLAFKLLDGACLQHKDRQLILTGINYAEVVTMFKQMKTTLKTFFGEQSTSVTADDNGSKSSVFYAGENRYSFGRNRGADKYKPK